VGHVGLDPVYYGMHDNTNPMALLQMQAKRSARLEKAKLSLTMPWLRNYTLQGQINPDRVCQTQGSGRAWVSGRGPRTIFESRSVPPSPPRRQVFNLRFHHTGRRGGRD
jgi:hypothetical protein